MKIYSIAVSLLIIILSFSRNSFAQTGNESYQGFKAAFGVHALNLNSRVPQLKGLHAKFDGGSVGVVKGNKFVRAGLTAAGFFYSTDHVPQTIDLIYSDATVSFFPMAFARRHFRVQPYLSSGVSLSRLRFYGHYLSQDPSKPVNYSASEPYLGKQRTVSAVIQFGLEYRLPQYEFLTLFAEGTLLRPITSQADQVFEGTSVHHVTSFQIGMAFGTSGK